jgi:nitrite reductase (NADH) small subunit
VHRHAFDLRTGQCLDVEQVSVPAYDVRIADGVVLVGPRRRADSAGVGEPPSTASSSSSSAG